MTVRILQGDALAMLKTLDSESVNCIVTSPPYYRLRDYGVAGQIGLEESVGAWVEKIVAVFREARRVLRADGVCFVNLGDSYAGGGNGGGADGSKQQTNAGSLLGRAPMSGLKPKDLVGQPWRVAFAMQADGWYWRDTIVWAKSNPMPESVRDRCTKAWEPVLMFTKSERYWWDFDAMQEPVNGGVHPRTPGNRNHKHAAEYESTGDERYRTKAGLLAYAERQREKYRTPAGWGVGDAPHATVAHQTAENHRKVSDEGHGHRVHPRTVGVGHNARPRKAAPNAPGPKEAHDANDSAYGDGKSARMGRGAGWRERKLAESESGTKNNASFDEAMAVMPATRNPRNVWDFASEPFKEAHFATFPTELPRRCITAGCPEGGTVLDPFFGAGTTGLVADRMQRHCIGIELNPAYIEIAKRRITGDAPLFAEVEAAA